MKKKIETIEIGNREFDVKNHTYVMGILNVTPDSFSDGGKYDQLDRALFHAQEMIDDGADIIDVGGESTRPGYTMISDEEEIERTVPVVEALKERFDIPISIDTYKSKVAKANIKAGVDLVNDIWGMKYDKDMAKLVADTKVACCLMHNRDEASYKHFMKEMIEDIKESVKIAKEAGVKNKRIILDPGVGFGKTYDNNLEAIRCLKDLEELGYGVLLAQNACFPEELIQILREYNGELMAISTRESAIVHMVDKVVTKLDLLDKETFSTTWNQDMVIYQTLNENSATGIYDESGLSMNQFLTIRDFLVKGDHLFDSNNRE